MLCSSKSRFIQSHANSYSYFRVNSTLSTLLQTCRSIATKSISLVAITLPMAWNGNAAVGREEPMSCESALLEPFQATFGTSLFGKTGCYVLLIFLLVPINAGPVPFAFLALTLRSLDDAQTLAELLCHWLKSGDW
jgi:hypothetical protein